MNETPQWPARGVWGAMPSVAAVESFEDAFWLHRWIEAGPDGRYEQFLMDDVEQTKETVLEAAKCLNALEATIAAQAARIEALTKALEEIADMNFDEAKGMIGIAEDALRQGQPASESQP